MAKLSELENGAKPLSHRPAAYRGAPRRTGARGGGRAAVQFRSQVRGPQWLHHHGGWAGVAWRHRDRGGWRKFFHSRWLRLLRQRSLGSDGGVRVTIPRLPEEIAADKNGGTVMIEAWADRRRVLYCPVTKNELYVLLTCTVDDAAARAMPIDPATWAWSFPTMRNLFARIRADADWSQARWDRFQTVRLKSWSMGCVALLGDAAHAMPPYLAQGAGHAMMNALGLAVALQDALDLTSALKQWEARERPLTEHTQRWTRIYGTTMFLPRPLKNAWILIEKHIPWVGAQYVRAANQVPTGCAADAPL